MLDRFRRYWKILGPGLVTGAADDDPSGIATYSQTGALFGYGQLWAALFSYPFMTTIQEMCGRIGMITGDGLAGIMRKKYSKKVLYGAVVLLFVANTFNIGADLGAMADAARLIMPAPFMPLLIGITAISLALQIFVPYPTYAKFLKYLAFVLFAYIIAGFLVARDWPHILASTFIPHIELTREYALNIAAFLGTTISPYLFFWQADEEVEEEVEKGMITDMGVGTPSVTAEEITDMRLDTAFGMFVSNIVAFFIIVTVAATVGASGMHEINTAADAAQALRPVAGDFAFLLFALGIIGTGVLAVPVLAGSVGYAIAEAFDWKKGLGKRFAQARAFYLVIAGATVAGLLINFTSISPMHLLYYSAMLNGILAAPLMVVILILANDRSVMGEHVNGRLSNILGWTITVLMGIVGIAAIVSFFL